MTRKKERNSSYAYLLVFLQYSSLLYVLFSGELIVREFLLMAFRILSGVLGVWAILVMRIGHFNIASHVKVGAELVTSGPYRIVRHPMYTSIVLFTVPQIIFQHPPSRLAAFFVLLISLVLKMLYEEQLLKDAFPDYQAYMKRTKRVIPCVW
jgi:protein-S-isoprenylcysteine O-methyltransferase Ste14